MPKKLWNHTFTPADVSEASGGNCNSMTLRNLVRRNIFTSRIPEAKAGKPREFPLTAVYETAILFRGLRYGLHFALGKQAIRRRAEFKAGLERHGVWEGEIKDALRTLPEFEHTNLQNPWYWGIIIGPAWLHGAKAGKIGGPIIEGVRLFKGHKTIDRVIHRVPLGMILNITMIVAEVDDILKRRLGERKVSA